MLKVRYTIAGPLLPTGRAALARLLILATAIAVLPGCELFSRDHNAPRLVVADRLDQGLVIVLPGIEGAGPLNRGIRDGLARGGVQTGIRIHDWTLGPILAPVSQVWESRARSKADELASSIRAYQANHPYRPVVLIGHSGGCAVAVFALEKLPEDASVAALFMLAPSISPEYNLAPALGRVAGQAYSYHSPRDIALLGVGTWVFGTLDGKHTTSAGRTGFVPPRNEQELYRNKLQQIGWQPEMRLSGNAGGHMDWANQQFVSDYIAPRVLIELEAHRYRMTPNATQPDKTIRRPEAGTGIQGR